MRNLTNKAGRQFLHGEKGVTLIELLVVVAILGIIAAVIIPNVSAFQRTGILAAANDEASNVKTAAIAYYAREEEWPDTSDKLVGDFLAGEPRAKYDFKPDDDSDKDGLIYDADPDIEGGWGNVIEWDEGGQHWIRNS